MQTYYTYITTNPRKKVLYTGVTNNLERRLLEHFEARGNKNSFAGKYHCFNLIYFEEFTDIKVAIEREKEIKGWRRLKKEELIRTMNPNWDFLNSSFIPN